METKQRQLLPTWAVPSLYDIHLTPNLETFKFKGKETVHLEIKQNTSKLILHSREIVVEKASITQNETLAQSKTIHYEPKEQTVIIEFGSEIKVGKALLHLEFEGELNDKLAGFYRSKYTNASGEQKYLATTQFEPTDARRAFPCWDEPAIKAKFIITLTFPKHFIALSNMPPVSENEHDGLKTIKFDVSPIMSTYLVAFVIGEFEYVEGSTKEGVKFRVFTAPGKKDLGLFALDCGVKVLSYFSDYFAIPYPLPKQDMIAIPDFAAGAMENWGLITYRETALLCDPKNSPFATKSRVAYVVAHELAHQWFGNLVTMEWWTDLWLNEGFATFIGNQAVDHLFPEWDIWTQFLSDYIFRAQRLDSLRSSHPIEVPIYRSEEVDEIFDAISYSKGASVICMLANFLGEENFRNGLRHYLNKHKYGNTVTKDLWASLAEVSKVPVDKIMDNWTLSIGYPVITVEQTGDGKFKLSQRRFLADGAPNPEEDKTTWWVSIGARSNKSKDVTYVDLKEKEQEVTIDSLKGADWVKFNAGQKGFFKVKYSTDVSKRLATAVEKLDLNPVDRLGILGDAFALAQSGDLPLVDVLDLVKAYHNEDNYAVWLDLTENIHKIASLWETEASYPQFKKFINNLYKPIGSKLGWDPKPGESELYKLLRSSVLLTLGGNGDDTIASEARKRFDAYLANPESVAADIRYAIYASVLRSGNQEDFDKIFKIFTTADLHEEKLRALRALGTSKNEAHIKRVLEMAFSGEVRDQDIMYIFFSTTGSSKGKQLTWDFVKNNWSKVQSKFGGGLFLFGRIIELVCGGFYSEEKATEIEQFFKDKDLTGGHRALSQSLEKIRANAKFLERNRSGLTAWLKQYD
eukprot:TRINITY_DN1681_c0_g2_i1.p1 TRINITY_DN1681_c0_g2~~TRINITY_DN1681_c0_g2_i1.p1  ORF type:complete len:869 (-),score=193.44 TRINITY_DN1681_c0_g2_i1:446-3028(-)